MTKSKYLVSIDVQDIQNYLYSTGILRDAIGGSHVVRLATISTPQQILENCEISNDAEIIYAGGGNARFLFSDKSNAQKFVRAYSAFITHKFPLLKTVVYCSSFDLENIGHSFKKHIEGLEKIEEQPKGIPRFLRFGFEEVCKYTGAPVIGSHNVAGEQVPMSAACLLRADYASKVHSEIQKLFWDENPLIDWENFEKKGVKKKDFCFPKQLDDLGSEAGKSYLAIVHIDGNSIGNAFITLQSDLNQENIFLLKKLSDGIRSTAENSIKDLMSNIAEEIQIVGKEAKVGNVRLVRNKEGKYCLPIRPILVGGDDVTLVCDGRLGVCLSTAYLNKFKEYSKTFIEENKDIFAGINNREYFTCSAGVAIVKTHYPFRNAYILSEELIKSAKKIGRPYGAGDYNAIDFHVAGQNTRLDINKIRNTNYSFQDQETVSRLTFKPYFVGDGPDNSPHPDISTFYKHFDGLPGLLARNKLKELAASLHQGPEATKKIVDYLYATYRPPGNSNKNKSDFKEWVHCLSGDNNLGDSFFESVDGHNWSFLLDILECDTILARKSDFHSGLTKDIFWE